MTCMTLCYNMHWNVVGDPRGGSSAATQALGRNRCCMGGVAMRIEKEWLSVQEVANYLGVARPTIYRWAKESKIRVYKLAKGVARVRREDLEAFLQKAAVLYSDPADRATQPGIVRETAKLQLQATDPILDVLGSLSGEPILVEEIEKELY